MSLTMSNARLDFFESALGAKIQSTDFIIRTAFNVINSLSPGPTPTP